LREKLVSEERMEKLLEQKFQEGIEAGRKSLGEQLMQQRADLLEVQNGVLRSLQNSLPEVMRDCERALVGLAFDTAQRVVGELPLTGELVESAVKTALAELKGSVEYTVRLHPEDLALLERNQSGVLPSSGAGEIQFAADAGVSRGGCVVQTRFGMIDARRETKFERVREAALC
jgi:flagellar assembly protein FliH